VNCCLVCQRPQIVRQIGTSESETRHKVNRGNIQLPVLAKMFMTSWLRSPIPCTNCRPHSRSRSSGYARRYRRTQPSQTYDRSGSPRWGACDTSSPLSPFDKKRSLNSAAGGLATIVPDVDCTALRREPHLTVVRFRLFRSSF
jgi:hypothetical protein